MGVNLSNLSDPSSPSATEPPTGRAVRVPTRWLRRAAWATLAVNVAIVVTGGVVRLTGSGLGCPTWPRCTEESFRPHGEMTIHAAIEFGNRLITFLIAAVAIGTLLLAWRSGRAGLRVPAVVLALGVPAQAVIGGVTVLTDLNPWTVAFHLLVSMAMIGVAVLLVRRVLRLDSPPRPSPLPAVAARAVARVTALLFVVGWAVLYVGTVVTGSGPHAGDVTAPRNGLDPRSVSQLHTDVVFLLLGLLLAVVVTVAVARVPRTHELARATRTMLVVVLVQGTIGFVQYFTDLPVVLVALHLLGAALFSAAMTWLLLAARVAQPATSGSSATPRKSSDR